MKKLLLTTFALFAFYFILHGANPPYEAFLGTNGIVISSNPPQGKIIVDGRNLTNGFVSGIGFGDLVWTNENGNLHTVLYPASLEISNNFVTGSSLNWRFQDNSGNNWLTFTNSFNYPTLPMGMDVGSGVDSLFVDGSGNMSDFTGDGWFINGSGSAGFGALNLTISTSGDLTKIRNVAYNWPSAQGAAGTVLTNNGSGVLGWSPGGVGILSGTTNFINLSVQAAKLPTTNYAGIDAAWQAWETVYAKTNAEGAIAPLNATWQFMVPTDYAPNSLSLLINYSLLNTNGPNASNVVWGASVLSIRSGTTNNVHTNLFGSVVKGSNSWIAKYDGTNIVTNLVINLGSSAGIQARDLSVIKLERYSTEDTYGGAVALHGLQIEYTRP